MIIFDLQCTCGCQFEGWFEGREDFELQKAENILLCPECGSEDVDKILSPVSFHHSSQSKNAQNKMPFPGQAFDQAAVDFLTQVQEYVEKNFEDVGDKFTQESLKMHYGVEEPRNIRGVTTEQDEKMLKDEGIDLMKIPMVKPESDKGVN